MKMVRKTVQLSLLSAGFVFIFVVFSLFNSIQWNPNVTKSTRRSNIIRQSRVFPQGGGDVKFDQPWSLPEIRNLLDELPENSGTKYIVSNFTYSKGLGNLMFQLAALQSLAVEHDSKLVLTPSNLLRRAFPLTKDVVFASDAAVEKILGRKAVGDIEMKDCCSYHRVEPVFVSGIAVVSGYLQNTRYFHPQLLDETVKMMTFHADVKKRAANFLESSTIEFALRKGRPISGNPGDEAIEMYDEPQSVTVVGVHVRRGMDIVLNQRNIKHGHVAAPEEYYRKTMDRVKAENDKVAFIVCSDDPAWVHKTFKDDEKSIIMTCPMDGREVDMSILSMTDILITSTGTFSWWSAYLNVNAQQIYYYSGWPAEGSELDKMINKKEYFLDAWIPIQ